MELSDRVTVHANVKMKHKDATGKELAESVSGDDLHRKTGKWMEKSRTIDRKNDWYEETVTDPETGRVVHRCAEPLSRHRGHGSDKENSRK
ncbi:MAG: hypothetical protein M1398_08505 [Deltaproteobacteria bacterium]|nr:hypothetical protein [Deltaproteobacteria bacterium]